MIINNKNYYKIIINIFQSLVEASIQGLIITLAIGGIISTGGKVTVSFFRYSL